MLKILNLCFASRKRTVGSCPGRQSQPKMRPSLSSCSCVYSHGVRSQLRMHCTAQSLSKPFTVWRRQTFQRFSATIGYAPFSLNVQTFSTTILSLQIFCDITYMVTSCTENEANRLGRFLCAMLDTVMRWHRNKETYDDECANFPGFVTKFKVSNQFSDANDHVGYENYRHVCHKWHYKITKALVVCLDSKDYVQIRNSLIILIKILPHFPVLIKLFHIIDVRIEKVSQTCHLCC